MKSRLNEANNRLTNMMDTLGTTRYAYDRVSQLLSEDGPWDSDTVSYTISNRLRTGLSLQAPNASTWEQSYAYDAAWRLTNTASPAGAFTYSYTTTAGTTPGRLIEKLLCHNI